MTPPRKILADFSTLPQGEGWKKKKGGNDVPAFLGNCAFRERWFARDPRD
jgi:hypothetical protein